MKEAEEELDPTRFIRIHARGWSPPIAFSPSAPTSPEVTCSSFEGFGYGVADSMPIV
jgi:hypothetical protein